MQYEATFHKPALSNAVVELARSTFFGRCRCTRPAVGDGPAHSKQDGVPGHVKHQPV